MLRTLLPLLAVSFFIQSCQTIELYEKSVTIPGHAWDMSYKPVFNFTIKDTAVPYKLYVVLRHTDKYNYNNIYVNITTRQPGQDSARTGRYDPLYSPPMKKAGWAAAWMIYMNTGFY